MFRFLAIWLTVLGVAGSGAICGTIPCVPEVEPSRHTSAAASCCAPCCPAPASPSAPADPCDNCVLHTLHLEWVPAPAIEPIPVRADVQPIDHFEHTWTPRAALSPFPSGRDTRARPPNARSHRATLCVWRE